MSRLHATVRLASRARDSRLHAAGCLTSFVVPELWLGKIHRWFLQAPAIAGQSGGSGRHVGLESFDLDLPEACAAAASVQGNILFFDNASTKLVECV